MGGNEVADAVMKEAEVEEGGSDQIVGVKCARCTYNDEVCG